MMRRQLVEGLREFGINDPEAASRVISGETPALGERSAEPVVAPSVVPPLRVPFTSKLRQDYARAVKRASLERQLTGQRPNEIQEIIEEALTPWLKANGYLP